MKETDLTEIGTEVEVESDENILKTLDHHPVTVSQGDVSSKFNKFHVFALIYNSLCLSNVLFGGHG